MHSSSRRQFLAHTGAAAAAAGAATLIPTSLAGKEAHPQVNAADFDPTAGASLSTTLWACVSDVGGGEVTIVSGEREITLIDTALAHRIAELSGKGA